MNRDEILKSLTIQELEAALAEAREREAMKDLKVKEARDAFLEAYANYFEALDMPLSQTMIDVFKKDLMSMEKASVAFPITYPLTKYQKMPELTKGVKSSKPRTIKMEDADKVLKHFLESL